MSRPNHRPRRNTPEQVEKAVDEMIAEYESTQDISALHDIRLMEKLNVRSRTLDNYYSGESDRQAAKDLSPDDNTMGENGIKQTYCGALKKLISYRQLTCIRHLTEDRFNSGWIFLSKQPHWGGFQDVQRGEQTVKADFRVTLTGPDGKTISG